MKWPFGGKGKPQPNKPEKHPEMTQQEYDELHDSIRLNFMAQARMGRPMDVRPNERFRLTWLCKSCSSLHQCYGTAEQVQNTLTAFMFWGYPFMEVTNMGLAEVAAMEGLDMTTSESRAKLVEEYSAFLEATRT